MSGLDGVTGVLFAAVPEPADGGGGGVVMADCRLCASLQELLMPIMGLLQFKSSRLSACQSVSVVGII